MGEIKLSVIIPTRNRSNILKNTLTYVISQTMPPGEFEVLVIDNGSSDNTKEIVVGVINNNRRHLIRYIYESEPGLLSGRHRGALEAKGEIFIFIDDDIEADKEWLSAIKETFDLYPEVQLVGGRNLPKFEIEPPQWIKQMWDKPTPPRIFGNLSLLDLGEKVCEIHPNYVWGLNFSIRKSALFELGGFHPDGVPKHLIHFRGDGETGLTIKAKERGYKAIYQPNALIYHNIPANRLTYEYFCSRYFYQGVSDSYTAIRRRYSKYKSTLKERAKDFLRPVKRSIVNTYKKMDTQEEIERLKMRFNAAWTDGYNFHQSAIKKKPELLKWVLKDDYWDYRLPKLEI